MFIKPLEKQNFILLKKVLSRSITPVKYLEIVTGLRLCTARYWIILNYSFAAWTWKALTLSLYQTLSLSFSQTHKSISHFSSALEEILSDQLYWKSDVLYPQIADPYKIIKNDHTPKLRKPKSFQKVILFLHLYQNQIPYETRTVMNYTAVREWTLYANYACRCLVSCQIYFAYN